MNNNMLKEISDYVSPVNTGKQGIAKLAQNEKVRDTEVRDLDSAYRITKSIRAPKDTSSMYGKSGETIAEEMERRLGANDKDRLSGFVMSVMTTTGNDLSAMQNEGYAPMDMDPKEFVSVADKIKVQLAKAGKDISMMGGVSDAALKNIANSSAELNAIEAHLESEDLPSDSETVKSVQEAYQKVDSLNESMTESISSDAVKVLIKNDSLPTIKDVYSAVYSMNPKETESISDALQNTEINVELEGEFTTVLEKADIATSEDNLKVASWLLDNELPVTAATIKSVSEYREIEVISDEKKVAIVDEALREGRKADEAYLVPGYSMADKAAAVAEAYVSMTKEAGVILQKLGIDIDTAPVEEMIDVLREVKLQGLESEEKLEAVKTTVDKIDELKSAPAETLGLYFEERSAFFLEKVTFSDFSERANALKESLVSKNEAFLRMERTYEGVGTEVRADYGDSIKKAFRNVDAILTDLNLDVTVANERAVRILGYNSIEINETNINVMKSADEMVQKVFDNLKPGTVLKMIREGINPLDMSMKELGDAADEMKQDMSGQSREDDMAKFLWKAEHSDGLTKEEKESYIGIFRMIHQVNKSDGALIGQLVQENVPITLRNLMMAARSKKAEGREYKVDGEFGYRESLTRETLTITQQAEVAFQANHLKHVEKVADPVKFNEVEKKRPVLEMTPEELDNAFSEMKENVELEKEWRENLRVEFKEASRADEKVKNIIASLNIDETPANMAAVRNMLTNGRRVFKNLATRHVNDDGSVVDVEDPDIRAMMQQVTERFGEDAKTPEEMARAQERLADIAEHAMDKVVEESKVEYLDVRSMQATKKLLGMYTGMAKQDIYHVSITVQTESGVLTLKIVKGEKNKGLVDVFIETGEAANTRAVLQMKEDGLKGEILSDSKEMEELFRKNIEMVEANLEKVVASKVEIKIRRGSLSIDEYLVENTVNQDKDVHVETDLLYDLAREFVKSVGKMN